MIEMDCIHVGHYTLDISGHTGFDKKISGSANTTKLFKIIWKLLRESGLDHDSYNKFCFSVLQTNSLKLKS